VEFSENNKPPITTGKIILKGKTVLDRRLLLGIIGRGKRGRPAGERKKQLGKTSNSNGV